MIHGRVVCTARAVCGLVDKVTQCGFRFVVCTFPSPDLSSWTALNETKVSCRPGERLAKARPVHAHMVSPLPPPGSVIACNVV